MRQSNDLTDEEARQEMERVEQDSMRFNLFVSKMFGVLALGILAIVIVLGVWPTKARAGEMVFQIGTVDTAVISVCADKDEAVKVADAVGRSQAEADKLFDGFDKCANMPMTFRVGNVVHVVNVGNTRFVKVVEITNPDDASQKLYWLTSLQIVKYKIQNET